VINKRADIHNKSFVLDKRSFNAYAENVEKGEGTNPNFPAIMAIDGDSKTYWESGEGPRWLGMDLGADYFVTKIQVQIISDGTRFYRYEIQASMDGIDWFTAAFKRDNRVEQTDGFIFNTDAIARHLRIYVMYNSSGAQVQVGEVTVWGYAAEDSGKADSGKKTGDILKAEHSDIQCGFVFDDLNEEYVGGRATNPSCVKAGDFLVYERVDFGSGDADQFRIRARVDSAAKVVSRIEVRLDTFDGPLIGSMPIYKQWKRRTYETFAMDISFNGQPLTGVHHVYIIASEVGDGGFGIYWVQFAKRDRPAPRPASLPLPAPVDEYNVYFGNIHCHTAFSDGESVPDQACEYAKHVAGLDILAITDHSNLFDYQFEPSKSRKWAELQRLADENTRNGEFVAIAGYEMTWYGNQGHMNVYNTELFETAGNMAFDNVHHLYEFLSKDPATIAQWNHPWDSTDIYSKLFPYHERFDKVLDLVEARAVEAPEKDPMFYYKDYIQALDLGWHVAPSGNEDNHKANWGTAKQHGRYVRTAFLVESLSREHIYDAIKQHRVYTTTDVNMKIIYTVNGQIMGSTLQNPSRLDFDIKVTDPDVDDKITRIEILSEGGSVVFTHDADASKVHIAASIPAVKKYYFLRVTQADGEMAITAPVWIEG
jgi:predicted metal-dependent phosphoesterase TrpH